MEAKVLGAWLFGCVCGAGGWWFVTAKLIPRSSTVRRWLGY